MFALFLIVGLAALALGAGLLPMLAVRLQLGALLAADATTLAPAALANKVALIIAPFTPSENLLIGGLTFGSTNSLTPIDCAVGAQEVAVDVVSNAQIITIVPGAGSGFRWVSSGVFAGNITVFGCALIDNGATTLIAVQALDTPVVFSAAGQQLDLDPLQMVFVLQPLS